MQVNDANETKPSAFGERIVPQVDQELKKKFEKAAALKEKGKKVSVKKGELKTLLTSYHLG